MVTLFPEAFGGPLQIGLLGKSISSGLLHVQVHDLRDWASSPHRKVDDAPFGGGPGMVMSAQPVVEAVETVSGPGSRVILMTAAGRPLTHAATADLSSQDHMVIVCGRYEGMDERIGPLLGAQEISIGQFVLSGGEFAALALIDAVSRLIPGVLGNEASLGEESFSGGLLEYPQYTRPAMFRGQAVPEVLLSGHHRLIASWRREQALKKTFSNRPELLETAELTDSERRMIQSWKNRP